MQNLLYALILLCAFPAGYLLAYLCKDELKAGKKWFALLAAASLIAAVIIAFANFSLKFPSVLSLFFIIILCLMAIWKSHDKKWVR